MPMTTAQEEMLKEVHSAVVGNEKIGHVGLVKRVNSLESKETNRRLKDAGRAGFYSAIFIGITEFFKFLFK